MVKSYSVDEVVVRVLCEVERVLRDELQAHRCDAPCRRATGQEDEDIFGDEDDAGWHRCSGACDGDRDDAPQEQVRFDHQRSFPRFDADDSPTQEEDDESRFSGADDQEDDSSQNESSQDDSHSTCSTRVESQQRDLEEYVASRAKQKTYDPPPTNSRDALTLALSHGWIGIRELASAAGKSLPWVRIELRRMRDRGEVETQGTAKWMQYRLVP